MKNKIIYGKAAIGKTTKLREVVTNWKGKCLIFQNDDHGYSDMIANPVSLSILDNKDNLYLLDNSQVFLVEDVQSIMIESALKNVVNYLKNIVAKKQLETPVLIIFDEFPILNYEDILLSLLELNKVDCNFVVMFSVFELSQIRSVLPKSFSIIFELCEVECPRSTQNFSGELKVRFPKELHQKLVENASIQGVSLNSYITYKLTQSEFN